MKKSLLPVLLLSYAFLSILIGCNLKNNNTSNSPEREKLADGTYTLLDFEKQSELYSVRPYIEDILDSYGKIEIVEDSSYASNGNKCLKYSYVSGKNPAIVFYPEKSEYPNFEMDRVVSFGISVYNASSETKTITLSMVSGKSPLYGEKRELNPGLNTYTLEINPIVGKYRSEELKAFCISFETGDSCDFYFDNWTVTLGEGFLNETQRMAIKFVEAVENMGTMETVGADTLLNAYKYYSKLDDVCRFAVAEYYTEYEKNIKKLLEGMSWEEDPEKTAIAYFSEEYGVLQIDPESNASYVFTDTEFENLGGTTFSFDDSTKKTDISFAIASTVVDNFDYVSFNLKNDGDEPVMVSFNGTGNKVEIGKNENREIELPMSDIKESGNYITFESESMYMVSISTIYANTISRSTIYDLVLSDDNYSISGDGNINESKGKYSIQISNENVSVSPIKSIDSINVSQSVTLSMISSIAMNVDFEDSQGNVLKSVSLSPTVSIVTLSKSVYEKLDHLSFDGTGMVTISDMYLTRSADIDYMEVLLYSDYVTSSCDLDEKTVGEAFYYISLFESMLLYKQNYMKKNNTSVYDEIVKKAGAVSIIFKESLSRMGNETAKDNDYAIISDLGGTYDDIKLVEPLTSDEKKILTKAQNGELLKYRKTIFNFDDFSASYKFVADDFCIDWVGSVTSENYDGGNKLAINVERVALSGRNPNRIYVTFNGTISSEYDYTIWNIYNASNSDKTFFLIDYGWSNTISTYTLYANSWNEIKIYVGDVNRYNQFVIVGCDAGDKIYIDNVYAYSRQYVQAKIDALPSIDDISESDEALVLDVRNVYNKLSTSGRSKVNADHLLECEEKVFSLPYRTIFNMENESVFDRITHPVDISAYLWDGEFSLSSDETYGPVLSVHTTGTTGRQPVLYLGYKLSGIDLSNYKTVKFSIYNPTNRDIVYALITYGYGMDYYVTSLKANSWTEIEVPVESFIKAGYFYFAEVGQNEEVTFLITSIKAYK